MDLKPDSSGRHCGCPTDSRIGRHFDTKVAERSAKCQDPSLIAVSQRLRDALLSREPAGKTVLELGCGRGALLFELVQAGVARATGVDLSPAGIDAARDRFERAQLSEPADLSVGDAARISLERHDWVILDRVMCCYPDIEALLANTLPAAGQATPSRSRPCGAGGESPPGSKSGSRMPGSPCAG